jgi:hypothetical protein
MHPASRRAPRAAAAGGVLAVAALLSPAAAQAAPASTGASDTSAPPVPEALYGVQDPTYDGAFRQGTALAALVAAGRAPAAPAVSWLVDQQCADGGYMAFRADPSTPCDAKAEDTNSTAMAVQGLVAVASLPEDARPTGGSAGPDAVDRAVTDAVGWLEAQQNPDGGVGYNPGGATDANSTALLLEALRAVDAPPSDVTSPKGNTAVDALLALRLGCDATPAQQGAFAFQPDGSGTLLPNDSATAAAVRALAGAHLPVDGAQDGVSPEPLTCGDDTGTPTSAEAAGAGAAYLADRLAAHDGTIPPLQGSTPDYFTTANAGLALAAAGDRETARTTAATLDENLAAYVTDEGGDDRPAALASLVLLDHATGAEPAALAARLADTGPAAPPVAQADEGGGAASSGDGGGDVGDVPGPAVAAVGVVVAAGVVVAGVGLLRRRGS